MKQFNLTAFFANLISTIDQNRNLEINGAITERGYSNLHTYNYKSYWL